MFCPNCGTSNDEGALFCANCGTRLEIEPVVTEGSAASDDNAVPQQPEAQPQVQESQADAQARGYTGKCTGTATDAGSTG